MEKAIRYIMQRKYDGYKVYAHNLSHFDGIFMIDILSKLGTVKPLMRGNKILKLNFTFKLGISARLHRLIFMDSLLMLPNSLDRLSKSFNVVSKKSIFPHLFLDDKNISLNYVGKCPDYKFFTNVSRDDYNKYAQKYINKPWVLMYELTKYCENDTISLYQVLASFQKFIYQKFHINFINYPTIPSLAFAIYRKNYLPADTVPNIKSKLHNILKQSYFGGICEVYKTFGDNIRSYDVNSLYPSAMKTFPMPTGIPVYVKGTLDNIKKYSVGSSDSIPFGFYMAKITAPVNMDKPILPFKLKTADGYRTTFPLGT